MYANTIERKYYRKRLKGLIVQKLSTRRRNKDLILKGRRGRQDLNTDLEIGKRYPILNTYVNALSMDESVEAIEKIIKRGIPTQHVVVNALKVNLMKDDKQLRRIVNLCPLINADGASVVWAAKKLGVPLKERVTGIDYLRTLLNLLTTRDIRFIFLEQKRR